MSLPESPPTLSNEQLQGSGLIETYERSIEQLGRYIDSRDVDYVVALSRSGPRVLERFEREGLIEIGPPVITELSLEAMDDDEINRSEFLVFDDIVIAGTTLFKFLTNFTDNYHENVEVVTLAADRETVGLLDDETLEALPQEDTVIPCGEDGERRVDYRTFVSLDRRERFRFSKKLIHCVSKLNKPYDLDFAVFQSTVGDGFSGWLRSRDDTQEVTTAKQRGAGLERYSLLVDDHLTKTFCEAVFDESVQCHPRISKLRVYYDVDTGVARLVPILLLSLSDDELDGDLFADEFSVFDKLLSEVQTQFLEESSGDTDKTRYRLAWYLVSYLFGLFLHETLDTGGDLLPGDRPEQLLQKTDLSYLFGPSVADSVFGCLADNQTVMWEALSTVEPGPEPEEVAYQVEQPPNPDELDEAADHWRLYADVRPGLEERLSDTNTLQANLAVLLEQLYVERELDTQNETGELGEDKQEVASVFLEDVGRLETGFTVPQIAGILAEHTSFDAESSTEFRRLSVAVDLLVDKGEQVPIFQYDETSGQWNRGYRHGESAFILFSEFRAVMYRVMGAILDTDPSGRARSNITVEKIAVLVWKAMCDNGYADKLDDPSKKEVYIQNTFQPFGHTLAMETADPDRGHEGVRQTDEIVLGQDKNFVDWAQDHDVIEETEAKQHTYRQVDHTGDTDEFPSYLPEERHTGPEGAPDTPSLDENELEHLKSIAKQCVYLYESGVPDILIGMTSCSDNRTYLHALRRELEALFDEDRDRFRLKTEQLEERTSSSGGLREWLPGPLCSSRAGRESRDLDKVNLGDLDLIDSQIKTKVDFWDELPDRTEDARQSLQRGDGNQTAKQTLISYLEEIQQRREQVRDPEEIEVLIQLVERCVRLARHLTGVVRHLAELAEAENSDEQKAAVEAFDKRARDFNSLRQRSIPDSVYTEIAREIPSMVQIETVADDPSLVSSRVTIADLSDQIESALQNIKKFERLYNNHFTPERLREHLNPIESTVWSEIEGFALYWDVEGVSGLDVRRELSDEHEPLVKHLHTAESAGELTGVLEELLEVVKGIGGAESVTVGVASAGDVPGRFDVNEDRGLVDPRALNVLAQQLQEKATEFNDTGDYSGMIHTVCVTRDVRNVLGGVVPENLNLRTDRVERASTPGFEYGDFDLDGNEQEVQYTVETFRDTGLGAFGSD